MVLSVGKLLKKKQLWMAKERATDPIKSIKIRAMALWILMVVWLICLSVKSFTKKQKMICKLTGLSRSTSKERGLTATTNVS